MVILGINNFQTNSKTQAFGARTRSEREAERERAYTRYVQVSMPEEDLEMLESAKKELRRRRLAEHAERLEKEKAFSAERQYKEDTKDLRDTQNIIREITQSDKDKNIFAGSWLQRAGKIADIVITGTLSGMALHWSTGKAFMMMNKLVKKPKIAKTLGNIKKPFKIVGTAAKKGAKTAWESIVSEVKASKKGQTFLKTDFMKSVSDCADDIQKSWSNFKKDVNNLTAEDYKSGISTVFGISGFAAGVVEKLDSPQKNKSAKEVS